MHCQYQINQKEPYATRYYTYAHGSFAFFYYILKIIPTTAPSAINTSGCAFLNTEKPANTAQNRTVASMRIAPRMLSAPLYMSAED